MSPAQALATFSGTLAPASRPMHHHHPPIGAAKNQFFQHPEGGA